MDSDQVLSGGALGALVLPLISLAVFIILPIYYGVTSHGPGRGSPRGPSHHPRSFVSALRLPN